ncbi:hypothetical protein ARMSODRAFT_1061629 [Armillaria solidipes]|uniref:Uncharacterized protein n=1 Tax=Armillaria solidipes TaxID=1076256 RepID=A0A2H3B5B9_9AGAR|nr:hypothetical protein ARMSODRAFT_1061629 [Armillaria solidipes]
MSRESLLYHRDIGLRRINELATKSSDNLIVAGVRNSSTTNHFKKLSANPRENRHRQAEVLLCQRSQVLARVIETMHGHCRMLSKLRDHLKVNVIDILAVFQVVYLLFKVTSSPWIIAISSPLQA